MESQRQIKLIQVRVGTRYTGMKTAVKTDYESEFLSSKERERGVLEQWTKMPHHTKGG